METQNGELEVVVKPLPPPVADASGLGDEEDVCTDVVLRWLPVNLSGNAEGRSHLRHLERSLGDFERLERRLGQEAHAAELPTIAPAIRKYRSASSTDHEAVYTPAQRGVRLAFALETYVSQLITRPELLSESVALKTFLHAGILSTHAVIGQEYCNAVDAQLTEVPALEEQRVAAGCVFEHQVPINLSSTDARTGDEDSEVLVLWKFRSQGRDLVFSASFEAQEPSSVDQGEDPYSLTSDANAAASNVQREVVQYRTACDFPGNVTHAEFVYGHWVARSTGVVTLQWENVDMNSVLSKPLEFQAQMVSLSAAHSVIEVERRLGEADAVEWLLNHVKASELMSVKEIPGWNTEGASEGSDGEYASNGDHDNEGDAWGGGFASNAPQKGASKADAERMATLERWTQELEAKVFHLEDHLVTTKKELKAALEQVQISEEIYKASLETITQLECASAGNDLPSESPKTPAPVEADVPTPEIPSPSDIQDDQQDEIERLQKLCASFQEQCLWRSIETSQSDKRGLELEAQLSLVQDEVALWREKHSAVAGRLEAMETENRKLRAHKAVLVKEVKKLQPYSQVNLAALVQEAQEARMMQRSLQTQLDLHERQEKHQDAVTTGEDATSDEVDSENDSPSAATNTAADFVIVEPSDHGES